MSSLLYGVYGHGAAIAPLARAKAVTHQLLALQKEVGNLVRGTVLCYQELNRHSVRVMSLSSRYDALEAKLAPRKPAKR